MWWKAFPLCKIYSDRKPYEAFDTIQNIPIAHDAFT